MESDPVKQRNQRNRRRERAQRMQQQRQSQSQGQHGHGREGANDAESGDEDTLGQKHPRPPRPQPRRKRKKEPMFEEDLIDGFAIVSFRSYEDLEKAEKYYELHKVLPDPTCCLKQKEDTKETKCKNAICVNNSVLKFSKLSYPPTKGKDPDRKHRTLNGSSSHLCDGVVDRLSDDSSHTSSGRGYICDSETEDDRASDAGSSSDLFLTTLKRDPLQVNNCNARQRPASCLSPPTFPTLVPSPLPTCTTGSVPISCSGSTVPVVSNSNFKNAVAFSSHCSKVQVSSFVNSKPAVNSNLTASTAVTCTTASPSRSNFHNLLKPYSNNCPTHTPHTNLTITNHCPEATLPTSVGLNLIREKDLRELKRIEGGLVTNKHSHTNGTDELKINCESAKVNSNSRHVYVSVSGTEEKNKTNSKSISTHISRNAKLEVKKEPPLTVSTGSGSTGHPISSGKTPPPLPPAITSTHLPVTTTTTSHREVVSTPTVFSGRTHSPRGHSPNRERESFSSNVSSLSRGSITPSSSIASSLPCSTVSPHSSKLIHHPGSSGISGVTSGNHINLGNLVTTAPPHSLSRPTIHAEYSIHPPSLGHPGIFSSTLHPAAPPNPNQLAPLGGSMPHTLSLPGPSPYVENSIFSHAITRTSGTDLLRRELDSRFLASAQDRLAIPSGPQYLRTEMHHHQHQHTHLHQHSSLLPPIGLTTNPSPSILPSPLFKDLPKLGGVDSPFYRPAIATPGYAGLPQILPHQVPGGPSAPGTPFVTSNHLTAFQPKNISTSKARSVKTGRWNAMHVRIAWEISNHQQKQKNDPTMSVTNKLQASPGLGLSADLLRPPGPPTSHLFSSLGRPSEISPFSATLLGPAPTSGASNSPATSHRLPFESSHPSSLFSSPVSQNLTAGLGHFQRYPGTLGMSSNSPYAGLNSLNPNMLGGGRDLSNLSALGGLPSGESWNRLSLGLPGFQSAWPMKSDIASSNERREREENRRSVELERERREREHHRLKEIEKQKEIDRQKERDRELRLVHRSANMTESNKSDDRDRERLRENNISHLSRIDDRVHRKSDHLSSLSSDLSNFVKKEEGFHELKPSDPKSSFLMGHPQNDLRVKEEPKLMGANSDMKLFNHGAEKDNLRHSSDKHFNKINIPPPNHLTSGNYPDRGQIMSSLGVPGALSGIDPRSAPSSVNSYRTSMPVIDMFRNPFSQPVRTGLESFDREQRDRELMHRFGPHSMNVLSLPDRYRDPRSGPSLDQSNRELERHLQFEREKQATLDRCKLGAFPPISSSGVFQTPSSLVSSLNSPYRNLTSSFLSNSLHPSTMPHAIAPPPLIPANQNLGSSMPKLTPPPGRSLENSLDSKKEQSQSR